MTHFNNLTKTLRSNLHVTCLQISCPMSFIKHGPRSYSSVDQCIPPSTFLSLCKRNPFARCAVAAMCAGSVQLPQFSGFVTQLWSTVAFRCQSVVSELNYICTAIIHLQFSFRKSSYPSFLIFRRSNVRSFVRTYPFVLLSVYRALRAIMNHLNAFACSTSRLKFPNVQKS